MKVFVSNIILRTMHIIYEQALFLFSSYHFTKQVPKEILSIVAMQHKKVALLDYGLNPESFPPQLSHDSPKVAVTQA